MANIPTPNSSAGVTQTKKDTAKYKMVYCILCRKKYSKYAPHEHMHSMLHHRELDIALGRDSFHKCQACGASSMCLNEYAQHISTPQHKAKLQSLMSTNVKPVSLYKILGKETLSRILKRNKRLKKKRKSGKKKKQKQEAGKKNPAMPQGTVAATVTANESKYMRKRWMRTVKQPEQDNTKGNHNVFVQNKENKMSGRPTTQHQIALTAPNQSGESVGVVGEPRGRIWYQPQLHEQLSRSAQHMRYDNKCVSTDFIGNNGSYQTDRPERQCNTQGGRSNMPDQWTCSAIGQNAFYNQQYDVATNVYFASDKLPQIGPIIIDHDGDEISRSSQPRPQQALHGPVNPVPISTSACPDRSLCMPPIRDVDICAMLRQIRRTLCMREPCRADRDTQHHRQSSRAGAQEADHSTAQQPRPEDEHATGGSFRDHSRAPMLTVSSSTALDRSGAHPSLHVNTPAAAASHPAVCTSKITPAKPKQTTRTITRHPMESSEAPCNSNKHSNIGEEQPYLPARSTANSLGLCKGKTTVSAPNLKAARRIRNVAESRNTNVAKEPGLKPTLQRLLNLSGAKSKLNLTEMYKEVKRKNQEMVRGMPRFGIELVSPLPDQEALTQLVSEGLPMFEGCPWESPPYSSCSAPPPRCPSPARPEDSEENVIVIETQSRSRPREPSVQPSAAVEDSVKVESNLEEDENGRLGSNNTGKRRRHKGDGGLSDTEPSGKMRKSNKDQDQMEQLWAVSLREEQVSQSLQDLDNSLIQARNALQAAYADVQRLMLLKQQFTADVNSLRTKRIEILQEMQEGYFQKASTSSAVTAATALTNSSATSSILQPSASTSASPLSHPQPTTPGQSVKQELCKALADGQASKCVKTTPSNADAPQTPTTQAVPWFPPTLFPSPVLAHSTSPQSYTSTTVLPSTDSYVKRVEQEVRGRLAVGETQVIDSDSEESGSDISRQNVRGNETTGGNPVFTFVPEGEIHAADEGGNESDASVEMVEPSDLVVINVDDSDNNAPQTVASEPVQPELPLPPICAELRAAGTQTFVAENRKPKLPEASVKVESALPPEFAAVAEEGEPSLGAFENHSGPVHDLQVHGGLLYTCSGDNTARAYSLVSRECQAVFEGHTNKVNSLLVSSPPNSPARLYTGSSDQTIRCYSIKSKKCLEEISLPDRVLCLHIAWNILFAGLANGSVASYDLKTLKQLDLFECHGPRGVSCLCTAQEGARRLLLVGSYDSTISVRDAKSGLLLRTLEGHTKTVLCMKVVSDLVFSGSTDASVHAHNIHTGELVRIYKGHSHAVTSIAILGKVMVTACLDKLVRVYEIQSHDRLQVYGGHSDMVVCMAIHKSVIYTGSYDGSIQAVKLNLMKNYRCLWQNCSLIFGVAQHLVQHLVGDHTNPKLQTVKCRWGGCSTFFATQHSVRQELPEHMQSHVEGL